MVGTSRDAPVGDELLDRIPSDAKAARKAGLDVGRDPAPGRWGEQASGAPAEQGSGSPPGGTRPRCEPPTSSKRDFAATRPNQKRVADFERHEAPSSRPTAASDQLLDRLAAAGAPP